MALGAELDRRGFLSRGRGWVGFEGCQVHPIEIFTPEDWHLDSEESSSLLEDAEPFLGYDNLRLPAPHHGLLILALRTAWGGRLQDRHRARIRDALRKDPKAWHTAIEHEPAWPVPGAVAALRAAYEQDGPGSSSDAPADDEHLGLAKRTRRAVRKPTVIALSGLDGSGKTTQAHALRDALDKLGFDSQVVWVGIDWTTLIESRALYLVARPIKALLRVAVGRPKPGSRDVAGETAQGGESVDPARQLRERSPALTSVWTLVIALNHVLSQRRAVASAARRGHIVICDRYSLDAVTRLRYIYGRNRRLRAATSLIDRLTHTPVRAYFIEVPPEVALARKQDVFSVSELHIQAELYKDLYPRLHVARLSGVLSPEELCEFIARDVWMALA